SFSVNCLSSAFKFPSAAGFEWIVVDNDSQDNSEQMITSQFPSVRWINMGYNAGFARANNEGIRQCKGDTVLLLNPDTLIIDDAIAQSYLRLQNDPNAIAAAPQLLNADGSPQITGNFFMKGGLNHLLPLPYLGKLLRTLALFAGVKKTNIQQAAQTESVDWINGAFLMVKKEAIEKAGLMDEDFFLYAEEIEWCSRLQKQGKLLVYGDLYTTHLQGETINTATESSDKGYFNLFDKKGLQLLISMNLRIRKQFGVAWFLFHLVILTLEIPLFFICSILHNSIRFRNPFTDWAQISGYTSNVFRLLKLSPTIIANKPYFYKMF
ncbi:MAG TPA: glycosyltransferase family 2 protein, partial [Ferruginibacter sp.]|nr:glycosyltransferase family 2 protein [Ferruginibacter sp.]